uniref:G-protein coupled receptors family 1 profile domain-containing protein n=1 Tax=Ditylenchus dipsaci TaxID=166011 RepID=A0A915DYT1_9BILA
MYSLVDTGVATTSWGSEGVLLSTFAPIVTVAGSRSIPTTTTSVPAATEAAYNDEDYLNALSDDDYIDFVANFLRPTFIECCFVLVFLMLMLVGIVGNCMVVWVVSRNRSMVILLLIQTNFITQPALDIHEPVLNKSSAVRSSCACVLSTTDSDQRCDQDFLVFGAFLQGYALFQNCSVYVSVLTLICISVERWKAISNPLAIPFWRTHQVICVLWLISGTLSIPEPLTLKIYSADYARKNLSTTWGTRCKESWSAEFQQKYQLIQTITLFITPLLIISGFCIHMSIILKRKALQIGARQLRDRKRAIKMLVFVVLIFAISYMPVHLHNIATAFHIEPQDEPNLTMIAFRKFIPRFMSYSSSVLNPILYNFMSEKFRKEFRRACCLGVSSKLEKQQQQQQLHKQSLDLRRSMRYSSVVVNSSGNNTLHSLNNHGLQ